MCSSHLLPTRPWEKRNTNSSTASAASATTIPHLCRSSLSPPSLHGGHAYSQVQPPYASPVFSLLGLWRRQLLRGAGDKKQIVGSFLLVLSTGTILHRLVLLHGTPSHLHGVPPPTSLTWGKFVRSLDFACFSFPKQGSFSAASNVTGGLEDVDRVTAILHRAGALALWDYATAAPYVHVDMNPAALRAEDDQVRFFSLCLIFYRSDIYLLALAGGGGVIEKCC